MKSSTLLLQRDDRRLKIKIWPILACALCLLLAAFFFLKPLRDDFSGYPPESVSEFCNRLKAVGRILETEDYFVWGCSPIYGEDGKVHVFYSRWPKKFGMGGWIHKSEIAHAIADSPEGPYLYVETVLKGRPNHFDSKTCHNPHIQKVDSLYCLFYMGNSDGTVLTKRIGLAVAKSLYGPWHRKDTPLIQPGETGNWDDCCTTNPAFLKISDNEYRLYYKSWNLAEYESQSGRVRANRKYGLAIAQNLFGPYHRYPENPIIDFSGKGNNRQVEDAFIFKEGGKYKMLMRDMGYFDHTVGLIFESDDGIHWSDPKIAWFGAEHYVDQPSAPPHLNRYGRFERPQILLKNGKPEWLFTATQGGKFETASGFVFKIKETIQ